MCGITGYIGKTQDKDAVVRDMTAAIFHRGPDEDGFFVDGVVGLGMRRLSIIDLSTGKQPIWSQDRKKCIFFNGEIYNYKELRLELETLGVVFSTHSDTEVILAMYEMYRETEQWLSRLRGMFCFAIYNIETKEIFLARDFFGIKPLYFLREGDRLTAFSSEMKSFLKIPGFVPEVNDAAVFNYLSFQYNPLDEAFLKHVYKLPPAYCMYVDGITGTYRMSRYWDVQFAETEQDEMKTARRVREAMEDSVAHHMIADVPVGSFLSGGVDSSIIATLVDNERERQGAKDKLKTFTVGFEGLTEGNEAKETSDVLGTDHTEITVTSDEYFAELSKAVWHFDEPIGDPSAIGLYFVAREARKHVTVVLSGEGADELFGGYRIYRTQLESAKMHWLPGWVRRLMLSLPFEYFGKNYIRRVDRKLSDWYFGQKYFNGSMFERDEIRKLWKGSGEFLSVDGLYDKVRGVSESTQMQYVDIHTWLVGDILAKADKMTMAHSLELRVPFLDTKVSELAQTLAPELKWKGGETKYILRKAFEGIIPETTRNRKKLGFPTPVGKWFTKERTELYEKIYHNTYIQSHFDVDAVRILVDEHTSGMRDNARKIYLLLMLTLWHEVFIEGKR